MKELLQSFRWQDGVDILILAFIIYWGTNLIRGTRAVPMLIGLGMVYAIYFLSGQFEIYTIINELAAQGKAILFVSSYLPELLGVCDRLAVMIRGRLSPIRPVEEWSPEQVMAYATGGASS